jgi:hypothetical protein
MKLISKRQKFVDRVFEKKIKKLAGLTLVASPPSSFLSFLKELLSQEFCFIF